MPAKRAYGMDQEFYPRSPIVTRPVLRWPDNARVAASRHPSAAATRPDGSAAYEDPPRPIPIPRPDKLFDKLPINLQLGAYYNAVHPSQTGPSWQLRSQLTFIF